MNKLNNKNIIIYFSNLMIYDNHRRSFVLLMDDIKIRIYYLCIKCIVKQIIIVIFMAL